MKNEGFFVTMSCVVTRGYKKKEQILEKKLGTIRACYLKRVAKEILPSRTIAVGVSMLDVKMEIPLENQEVNVAYWYYLWWKDIGSRAESFDEKINGNNCFPIGKQIFKNDKGRTRWVLGLKGLVIWLLSRTCGIDGRRSKIDQNPKISK